MRWRHAITLAVLAAAVGGCAAPGAAKPPAPLAPLATSAAPPAGGWPAWLQRYRWQLAGATDAQGLPVAGLLPPGGAPVELSFEAGRLALRGGCNAAGAGFTLDGAAGLQVAPLMATRRACAPELMRIDRVVTAVLGQPVQLATTSTATPRLQLTAADGSTLAFSGMPADASR